MTPKQSNHNLFNHLFKPGTILWQRCAVCGVGDRLVNMVIHPELKSYVHVSCNESKSEPTKYGYPEDWKSVPGNRGK